MAEPVGFEGAMTLLRAAPGTEDSVRDMPIFLDEAQIISCWRLTQEELAEVARTGVVWLSVANYGPPAPVKISGSALVLVDGRPAIAEPILPLRKVNK